MKYMRKMIKIDEEKCTGCGLCVPGCSEGALKVVDGKAKLVSETYCDGLGDCIGECPEDALTIVEVAAEDFNPDAVKEHLSAMGRKIPKHMPDPVALRLGNDQPGGKLACGCPSTKLRELTPCAAANTPKDTAPVNSNLSHWPIQLRLVPANAPFLRGAHLLITADCVAGALPNFHSHYLPGKKMLMGCPKFDDTDLYVERLTEIFSTCEIKSVTLLEMEVPCCSNMTKIVARAVEQSGQKVPVEKVVISLDGRVADREQVV